MALYAGYGMSDLTPEMGVELAGYGYYLERRCTSVRDPLHARCVYLEDGPSKQLIISCELLGLSREVTDAVKAHAEKYGIPPENVMLVSVHTHTGPCVKYHAGTGETDENYLAILPGRICRAADAAVKDKAPVDTMEYSRETVPGEDPVNRADPLGPVDRFVRGFILRRNGKPPIALLGAACHGVFLGRVKCVSADYAGAVCAEMEVRGFDAVYLNGLCGDIDPKSHGEASMLRYAKACAESFMKKPAPLPRTLSGGQFSFTVRLTPVTKEDIRAAAARAAACPAAPGADKVALFWQDEMLAKFDTLSDREDVTAPYCLLGGIPILALPFEGFTRIGMDIRAGIGNEDAMILGCAEELRGYLPTRDDFKKGAYAALESTFLYRRLPYEPGEAERTAAILTEELRKVLQKEDPT